MTQSWDGKLRGLKICGIRPETYCRPGMEPAHLAYHLQFRDLVAIGKRHVIFLTTTSDPHLQTRRERVHYRHTNAVQPTREAIIFQRKFSPGMEARQDD